MLHFSRWKIALILILCVGSVVLSLPNFMSKEQLSRLPSWFPANTVNLGLDLRGGSHLLLEVDFEAYLREQMNNLSDDVRVRLREAKVGYRNLMARETSVTFSLRESTEADIEKIIHTIDPELVVAREGDAVTISYNNEWQQKRKRLVLEQSLEIVNRRVNETGTREPIIQRQGEDRIVLQVPGLENPEHLKELMGRTAKMTFHLVDTSVTPTDIEAGTVPSGTRILSGVDEEGGKEPRKYAIFRKVEVSGDMLVDAHASYDQQNGEPVVAFRFNTTGAERFGDITTRNVGNPFAVVLDNHVITAPVIRSPILGGSGIIFGSFTVESANDLALLLRAGALPAPLKIVEERSVGPSLGSDSIAAGTKACLVGIALVVVFMTVFYGLFGVFANIAMIVNAFIILALMSLLGATLTLPGIAGIVLTMGMAVDTNVLIYERMREEMRNGKTVYAAIESGFRMAFGTIIDAHVTTLSAALILFYFGTGTVKGFGITLSIGILASLFTAILVTRLMIVVWLKRVKPSKLPI